MKGIADLHIHSRYSRATSKQGTPEYLDLWARKKGISILGTGDFTHPQWREELKEKLIPAEDGLYCLKKEAVLEESGEYKNSSPRFVLSGEISSIYKKNGKVFVRSGAGIVADSIPEKEFEECLNKAKSSLKALELAQEAES